MAKLLVGAIDLNTSRAGFCVYETPSFINVADHYEKIQTYNPKRGWYEQDAVEVIQAVYRCCREACNKLVSLGYNIKDIATIGISSTRDTLVVWDAETNEPLYRAIVWKDIRCQSIVDAIVARRRDKYYFRNISGLPISPLFPALKFCWLREHVPAVKKAIQEHRCKLGTVDSWLVWNLSNFTTHVTDVTNASRTLLMNIQSMGWDDVLLSEFGVKYEMLPKIVSSSELVARINDERCILRGVTVTSIIANQQSALVGHMCLQPGDTKSTYGSGCFLLCNTGANCVISQKGLITTVAYQMGQTAQPVYALEGNIAVAGHTLNWLQNNLHVISDARDTESIANVVSNSDVYFVPAFTGLYAPHWCERARGILIGMTQFTTKHHIVRAALEAICFQVRDMTETINREFGATVTRIYCDGPLSTNTLLMQMQADTVGMRVYRSHLRDMTAFGAAVLAANASSVRIVDMAHTRSIKRETALYDEFKPITNETVREQRYEKWKKTINLAADWVTKKRPTLLSQTNWGLVAALPAYTYMMTGFIMIGHIMRST